MTTETKPKPKYTHTSPNGTIISFWEKTEATHRHYTVLAPGKKEIEVPSVTTILKAADKPGLAWWGMVRGLEGAVTLMKSKIIVPVFDLDGSGALMGFAYGDGQFIPVEGAEEVLTELLNAYKITVNHHVEKASVRGQSAHDAFERWAIDGTLPDVKDYPLAEQGYITGLLRFFEDAGDAFVARRAEVMVGSTKHKFAGRYDLDAGFEADTRLVAHVYPKRPPLHVTVPGGSEGTLDLKTSKGVYPEYHIQLAAYAEARVENGYDPTDFQAVVHIMGDGRYEFVRTRGKIQDFKHVYGLWLAQARIKQDAKIVKLPKEAS